MSIKRLPPEAVETFSIVLHPKRTYSSRLYHVPLAVVVSGAPSNALATEGNVELLVESGDYLVTES